MRSPAAERLILFAVALVPRLLLAWLTFGSADLTLSFRNTAWVLSGRDPRMPYLPGIDLFFWLAAPLAVFVPVPLAVVFKIFPVLFDALTAVLLRDARSFRTGLLYAIAPVPAIVCAMHGNWDTILLYFLLVAAVVAHRLPAVSGVAWVLSFITKPLTLPLLPLLLDRPGELRTSGAARRRALVFLGSALASVLLYLALLAAIGRPLTAGRLQEVFAYAGAGEYFFGIPLRRVGPFARLWALIPLAFVTVLYWLRRLDRDHALLLFFTLVIGLSGLAAQYLCWVVPFALLAGRARFAAVYSLVAGVFLAIYYRTAVLNVPNVIALGAYGLLDRFAGLTPPLAPPHWRLRMQLLGNLGLPLVCIGFALLAVARQWRRAEEAREGESTSLLPPLLLFLAIAAAALWALAMSVPPDTYVAAVMQKVEAYDVVVYRGRWRFDPADLMWIPRAFTPGHAGRPFWNLSTILLAWVAGSSVVTALHRDPIE